MRNDLTTLRARHAIYTMWNRIAVAPFNSIEATRNRARTSFIGMFNEYSERNDLSGWCDWLRRSINHDADTRWVLQEYAMEMGLDENADIDAIQHATCTGEVLK